MDDGPSVMRVTGTADSHPQQSVHETVQCSATASEQARIINDCPEDSNHLESARFSDEVRADATTCEKAGDGIPTFDPIDVALHHEPRDLSLPAMSHRFC